METIQEKFARIRNANVVLREKIAAFCEAEPVFAQAVREGHMPWLSHPLYKLGDYALVYKYIKEEAAKLA